MPVVELFSSDLTQSAINPLSDEIKNPLEKVLKQDTCIRFSSELKALSTYYFNSLFSTKYSSPSAVHPSNLSSSSQAWSVNIWFWETLLKGGRGLNVFSYTLHSFQWPLPLVQT